MWHGGGVYGVRGSVMCVWEGVYGVRVVWCVWCGEHGKLCARCARKGCA